MSKVHLTTIYFDAANTLDNFILKLEKIKQECIAKYGNNIEMYFDVDNYYNDEESKGSCYVVVYSEKYTPECAMIVDKSDLRLAPDDNR